MSTGFQKRIEAGELFESELISILSNRPSIVSVCANGTEHTHPLFVERLRRNNSPASKFVRYAPDGVFLKVDGEVIHFDAKASKAIEKDAYDIYMSLHSLGCRVILFVKYRESIYYQDIDKLALIPGEETVEKFPREKRFPVVDGWVCPRLKSHELPNDNMSGTPYREIDFSSMTKLPK